MVPAFQSGADYEIPDEDLGKWIKTNPATHNDLTTAKNKTLGGNWVPLVKMLKSWNRANGKPIEPSFLVEVMALDLVDGPFNTFPDEARRFFAAAGASIADTWADPAKLERRLRRLLPGLLIRLGWKVWRPGALRRRRPSYSFPGKRVALRTARA